MKIKAILFDLDNTLYPESIYFRKIFEQFCSTNNIEINTFNFLFENFDVFRFTKKDIFKFALSEANLLTKDFHDQLFDLYISIKCEIAPYQGVSEWFEYCFANRIKIGVLTNGISKAQINKWACLKLSKDDVFFQPARDFPEEKPSAIAFDSILKSLGTHINDTVFVGDRFENDVEYGLKKGSKCILIGPLTNDNVVCLPTTQDAFEYFKKMIQELS